MKVAILYIYVQASTTNFSRVSLNRVKSIC